MNVRVFYVLEEGRRISRSPLERTEAGAAHEKKKSRECCSFRRHLNHTVSSISHALGPSGLSSLALTPPEAVDTFPSDVYCRNAFLVGGG
jgi:hypothetical protein